MVRTERPILLENTDDHGEFRQFLKTSRMGSSIYHPVSVGGLGEKGPKNVVYRSGYKKNPHNLVNWGGATMEHDEMPAQHHKEELPYDTTGDGVPNDPVDDRQPVVPSDDVLLDFGDDYTDNWKVQFGPWDG